MSRPHLVSPCPRRADAVKVVAPPAAPSPRRYVATHVGEGGQETRKAAAEALARATGGSEVVEAAAEVAAESDVQDNRVEEEMGQLREAGGGH